MNRSASLRCWSALAIPDRHCMLSRTAQIWQACAASHSAAARQHVVARRSVPCFTTVCAAAAISERPKLDGAQRAAQKPQRVITVDYTTLLACASGVETPARIEQVVQYDDRTVCLKLRTPSATEHLHLSWHQTAARLCLGPAPHRGAVSEAFGFGELLHSHLRGLILQTVALPVAWERVVELSVGRRPAEAPTLRLFLEVMGRHSNLVLADGGRGCIIAAGHQIGQKQSSLRQVQVGSRYSLPPPAQGLAPSADQPLDDWREVVSGAAQQVAERKGGAASLSVGMVRAFQGVSPSLAADLCSMAGVNPGDPPGAVTDGQWTALHGAWLSWLARVQSGSWAAVVLLEQNRYSVVRTGTPTHPGGASAVVHEYYSSIQGAEASQLLRQRIQRALGQVKSKLQAKVVSFGRQLRGSEEAAATQKLADMLMANLHRCQPRAEKVDLEDWETGEAVTLQLDPQKSAVQNAEALYRKAGKQRRAMDRVKPLLEAAEAEMTYLLEVELSLEQLDVAPGSTDISALRDIREELVSAGYMRAVSTDGSMAAKAKSKARKSQKQQRLAAFRQFTSPGGFPILVGRSNRQNDELTHSIAKPADIWLHARGVPGAHVLLQHPADRADSPTEADLQCAADLAAFYSKRREDTRCEVISSSPKHLSRPKGAKPGQVKVAKEDVVLAFPQHSLAALADSSQSS